MSIAATLALAACAGGSGGDGGNSRNPAADPAPTASQAAPQPPASSAAGPTQTTDPGPTGPDLSVLSVGETAHGLQTGWPADLNFQWWVVFIENSSDEPVLATIIVDLLGEDGTVLTSEDDFTQFSQDMVVPPGSTALAGQWSTRADGADTVATIGDFDVSIDPFDDTQYSDIEIPEGEFTVSDVHLEQHIGVGKVYDGYEAMMVTGTITTTTTFPKNLSATVVFRDAAGTIVDVGPTGSMSDRERGIAGMERFQLEQGDETPDPALDLGPANTIIAGPDGTGTFIAPGDGRAEPTRSAPVIEVYPFIGSSTLIAIAFG
jgi:hypothetical protein